MRIALRLNANFLRKYTMTQDREMPGRPSTPGRSEIGVGKEGESVRRRSSRDRTCKVHRDRRATARDVRHSSRGSTFPLCSLQAYRDEFNDNPQKYVRESRG